MTISVRAVAVAIPVRAVAMAISVRAVAVSEFHSRLDRDESPCNMNRMRAALSGGGLFFGDWGTEGVLMHVPTEKYFALDHIGTQLWKSLLMGTSRQSLIDTARTAGADGHTAEKAVGYVLRKAEDLGALVQEADGRYRVISNVVDSSTEGVGDITKEEVSAARFRPDVLAWFIFYSIQVRLQIKYSGLAAALRPLGRPLPTGSPEAREQRTLECLRVRRFLRNITTKGLPDCVFDSISTALLMRRQGIPAQVCIGVTMVPFKAHAWVEADRKSISERRSRHSIYSVIARF